MTHARSATDTVGDDSATGPGPADPSPSGPPPTESDLPIQDYDSLAASQVVPRLATLTPDDLVVVQRYEGANRRRQTILNRVGQLLAAELSMDTAVDPTADRGPRVRPALHEDLVELVRLDALSRDHLRPLRGGEMYLLHTARPDPPGPSLARRSATTSTVRSCSAVSATSRWATGSVRSDRSQMARAQPR